MTPCSTRRCAVIYPDLRGVWSEFHRAPVLILRGLLLVGTLLVAGCATTPPSVTGTAPEAAWLRHRASLQTLTDWQVQGRVAVRSDAEGWSADFDWQQRGEQYRIRLRGPFGRGAIELYGDALGVWLKRQGQAPVYTHDVERLLQTETGWRLPVLGLADWLRGLPVATAPAEFDWDQQGRLQTLQQEGWRIAYGRYRAVDERQLPDRLQLQRDLLQVKVVVDQWRIP